jgi:hypothetical protein
MAKIRIVGDSSGYVEIAAPNAAGNNTLELPSSGTRLVGSDNSGNVSISGITTFSSGPVLIGSGTSTGTASQPLQVTGSSYFNGLVGMGTTNPTVSLQLSPNASISNVGTGITLPNTVGSAFTVGQFTHSTGDNTNHIRIKATRFSSGGTWTTASTKIVNVTDVTEQGYIEFNPNGANYGLAFGTGNTEIMRMDSAGRVTRPYQPAFNASGAAGNVSYSAGNIFQFNTADLNVGSHFNTSTYRFTAPVAGVYLFGVSIYVNGNLSGCFTVNGTQTYGGSDVQPLVYGDLTRSYSAQLLVSLSANDIVDFRSRDATASSSIYMGHSNFWGYLM